MEVYYVIFLSNLFLLASCGLIWITYKLLLFINIMFSMIHLIPGYYYLKDSLNDSSFLSEKRVHSIIWFINQLTNIIFLFFVGFCMGLINITFLNKLGVVYN